MRCNRSRSRNADSPFSPPVILSLQSPTTDLFYGDPTRLEEDTRFLYCSVQALCLLGALDRIDRQKTIDAILSCGNFDGGFGRVRGAESHSGQGESPDTSDCHLAASH